MAKLTEKKSKKKKAGEAPSKRRGKTLLSEKGGRKNSAKRGPRLPSELRKEIDGLNPEQESSGEDVFSDDEAGGRTDVYEYEEILAQEESKKNRRFDRVDDLQYVFPSHFKDENVASDMDDDEELDSEAEDLEEKDERHARMLHDVTGMPTEAFQGKKRRRNAATDAAEDVENDLEGAAGPITIQDLLDPLIGEPVYSRLRKRMHQMENRYVPLNAPLPKSEREKLERKAAYEQSKKDITKWEPLVKRNREAPTVFFYEDIDIGYSTIGAIASEFKPRTQFEQKMSSLLCDPEITEAHEKDGARLLELNEVSVEDVKSRQSRLAKMRNLLFQHEIKAKRIKKIKSKTYRRLLRKDKSKEASAFDDLDSEAARELRVKQEFKRAEERMRLKHKNTSKWAKRIMKRGLNAQDENTRLAISEQLHEHKRLTTKQSSMVSSSDESSDEEDYSGSDGEEASAVFQKAKDSTRIVLEEDGEAPQSGVMSLPFMVRGLKKRREALVAEAEEALQEYDVQMNKLENENNVESPKLASSKGRRVFGHKNLSQEVKDREAVKKFSAHSDDEEEPGVDSTNYEQKIDHASIQKEVQVNRRILLEENDDGHNSLFKGLDDIARNPGPKTTFEVSIFASDSWHKFKDVNKEDHGNQKTSKPAYADVHEELMDGGRDGGDTDNEDVMVDGILNADSGPDYELPSQEDLIHRAFAGDDVEEEFEKEKMKILDEEVPEPEKPVLLPGWGQWADIQKKRGLPAWMVEEHENAKRKREDALKRRKDARLKNVIISEKVDKRTEKLLSKALPYPYTSKEVFEQSIRMPIGPEFNPASSVGALNRPSVVKRSGVIIKPIQFEEPNTQEKSEEARDKKVSSSHNEKGNREKFTKKAKRNKHK